MLEIASPDGSVEVVIDDVCGARLASLRIDSHEVLVDEVDDPLAWGCYPMVPYAGRVRDAKVHIGGEVHALPVLAPPHGLHGTVLAAPWAITAQRESHAELLIELDRPWPVPGTVRHTFDLNDDALTLGLTVVAHGDMPCQVGWHPWFVRPDFYSVPFTTLWPRDATGIPTRDRVDHDADHPRFETYDDCLSDPTAPIRLRYENAGLDLVLDSDCSHWVVFDQRTHAVCIEPQSGLPNQINDDPVWIGFGESLVRSFRIAWTRARR